jgi:hypothetical protein
MNAERRIAETATAQAGAFTREQAHAAGLTDRQLVHRVRHGLLDRIGPRTFRSPYVPRSLLADLLGVILDVGESWASGPTAAALHGFEGFGSPARFTSPSCVADMSSEQASRCTPRWSCR